MDEIVPGIVSWETHHEGIGYPIRSHWLVGEKVVIDPRVPEGGLDAFADDPPEHALLSNRHHHRHAARFRERFGTAVRCHEAGMHEFGEGEEVEPFAFGEAWNGVTAVEVGAICPEETALHAPARSALAIGDAIVNHGELGFVPEQYLGDDPEGVKAAIRAAARRLLDLEWTHLLLAHGDPIVDDGKARLAEFLDRG